MIDLAYRVTYRLAYKVMRVYWKALHPQVHGALVAIWSDGQILLIKNSYVRYYSLPGGYVHRGETGREAAVRETLEETGVRAAPADLRLALDLQHDWEGKREHVEIFDLELPHRPLVKVDNREVVEARFFTPEEALKLELFDPLRTVIERRAAARGDPT
jgi:8-oxo-dGTP pyrophosphatase MutT (NUDIX family)